MNVAMSTTHNPQSVYGSRVIFYVAVRGVDKIIVCMVNIYVDDLLPFNVCWGGFKQVAHFKEKRRSKDEQD